MALLTECERRDILDPDSPWRADVRTVAGLLRACGYGSAL